MKIFLLILSGCICLLISFRGNIELSNQTLCRRVIPIPMQGLIDDDSLNFFPANAMSKFDITSSKSVIEKISGDKLFFP